MENLLHQLPSIRDDVFRLEYDNQTKWPIYFCVLQRAQQICSQLDLFIFVLMIVCVFILVLKNWETYHKTTSSQMYAVKILNFLTQLLKTVLTIPLLQNILITFLGNNNPKYGIYLADGIYYCCVINAIFSLLCYILFQVVYSLFYIEISPFKDNPLAIAYNFNEVYKLGIKIVCTSYLILDVNKLYGKYYIIVLLLLSALWCYKSYSNLPLYNFPQAYIYDSTCMCVLWMSICVFLQSFVCPEEALGLYFTIVGLPMMIVSWWHLKHMKEISVMCNTYKTISRDTEIEYYILTMVRYIKRIKHTEERIKLEGILNYHILHCKRTVENCNCSQMNDYENRFKSDKEEKMWYTFVRQLLTDAIERFPRASRLYIITSYIEQEKLNNKYRALNNLVKASESKPSLIEQFLAFHRKQSIQENMISEDRKINERKTVDINKFLEFNNKLLDLREVLEASVNCYIQFWNSLIEQTPNLEKIRELGSNITSKLEVSKQRFEEICAINANNLECLNLYAYFLKEVVNDSTVWEKILENIKIIKKNLSLNKNFTDQEKLKYGQNSLTGIIIISGNINNLGIIQHCNTQVKTIIGYYMSDLIGQNISRIMPKTIGDYHDEVLKNYLDTSEQKFNFKERFAPMIDKDGFLVPCTIMTKSLPYLEQGIKLVGFFRIMTLENIENYQSSTPYYVFYREDVEQVQGLSKNMFTDYGIRKLRNLSSNQINNDITIKSLFGQILFQEKNLQSEKKGLGPNGFETELISMNPIPDEVSKNKGMVYRKHQIVLFEKIKLRYQGIDLKLLYFFQLAKSRNNLKVIPERPMIESTMIKNHQSDEKNSRRLSRKSDRSVVEDVLIGLEEIQVFVNQQQKVLREFKLLIGQQNEPRSIKALKRTGSLSFLFMVIIAIVGLVIFTQRITQISEGNQALFLSNSIISQILEINYYTRMMNLLALYQQTNDTLFANFIPYQTNASNLLSLLQSNQFSLVKLHITAASRGANTSANTLEWQLAQNGTLNELMTTRDLNLFDYITSASGMVTANISQLNFTLKAYNNNNPSAQYMNMYDIRFSGLFSLVDAYQNDSNTLLNFYYYFINQGQNSFLIILCVAIAVIVLAEIIAVPFIFSVVKINNRVLSLFGYINFEEVESLIEKCSKYLDKYLEDTPSGKIRMKKDGKNMGLMTQTERRKTITDKIQISQIASDDDQMKKLAASGVKKMDQQNQIERCEILMKSRDSSNVNIILQYSLFSLVFATYFIQDFVTSSSFLGKSQLCYNASSNLYSNINSIKKLKTLTLESIVDNTNFQKQPLLNVTAFSQTLNLYSIQRTLMGYQSSQFDPIFAPFFNYVSLYNDHDLCQSISTFNTLSNIFTVDAFNYTECETIGDNVLGLGLRPGIVGYIEESKILLNMLQNQTNPNTTINSPQMQLFLSLQKYIQTPSLMLQTTFSTNFDSFLQSNRIIFIIKFSIFVLVIGLLFVCAWMPFLGNLNNKIWMTKGMLNMIPLQLVNKNEKLKQQFISGSILNNVK